MSVDAEYETIYYSRGFLVGAKVSSSSRRSSVVTMIHTKTAAAAVVVVVFGSSCVVPLPPTTNLLPPFSPLLLLLLLLLLPLSQDQKNRFLLHNHVRIYLDYHQIDGEKDGFRVVGFKVRPFSVNHKSQGGW